LPRQPWATVRPGVRVMCVGKPRCLAPRTMRGAGNGRRGPTGHGGAIFGAAHVRKKAHVRRSSYQKGDVIIAEGEFTSDAYIINVGFVEAGHGRQRCHHRRP
jgi:hypothetical protein